MNHYARRMYAVRIPVPMTLNSGAEIIFENNLAAHSIDCAVTKTSDDPGSAKKALVEACEELSQLFLDAATNIRHSDITMTL